MRRALTDRAGEEAGGGAVVWVGCAVIVALGLLVPGGVDAEAERASIADGRPASIVVAPNSFQNFSAMESNDSDGIEGPFTRGAVDYAANHPDIFEYVTAEEVAETLRDQTMFVDKREVAEDWARMGIELYKQLETGRAIDKLKKAVGAYDEIDYHLVDPERMAEVLMYLSLSYLAEGIEADRAMVFMKRMIRLDPQRVLKRGYYPDEVVNFYESARGEVLREMRGDGPNIERARRLAELADVDLVAYGSVLPGEQGRRARVWVYSRRNDAFAGPERLRLTGNTGKMEGRGLRGAGNRLMGRFSSCVHEPSESSGSTTIVDTRGESPFTVHLDFAYMSWLKFPPPLEQPFGNVGLGVGGDIKLTEDFGFGVGIQILNSLRDYNGLLVDDFSTLRVLAGPDIGMKVGRFNFGARISVEGTHVGSIRLCTDFNDVVTGCKDPSKQRTFEELDFMLGISAEPRIRVRMIEEMYLKVGASLSYYFVPFSDRRLGYPLTGLAGVSYRF